MDEQEFIDAIYELAFGEGATPIKYDFEEVVEKVKEYSEKAFEFDGGDD